MFSQSGVFASSKSASQTFAPELSALMVIFRSVGPGDLHPPVHQARRGRRHAPERVLPDVAGLGQEVQRATGGQVLLAGRTGGQQLRPLAAELTLEHGDQAQRIGSQDLPEPVSGRAQDLDAIVSRHLALLFCAAPRGMWN